jgi:hypothetical protein
MPVGFEIAVLALAMVAIAFVGYPLVRATSQRNRGFISMPVLFVIVAIIAAIVIYALLGRPDLAVQQGTATPASSRMQSTSDGTQSRAGSVSSLLAGLEEKVAKDPADGDNWLLLAKSYHHLGRATEARDAYAKANALGRVDSALERLLSEASTTAAAAGPAAVTGRVALSPEAMSLVEPTDTVFIIARDAAGPPMPLAVVKTAASELPLTFSIGDDNSMVAGRNLSGTKSVVIEAKISANGDALSTKAGLSAKTAPFDPANPPSLSLMLTPATASQNGSE